MAVIQFGAGPSAASPLRARVQRVHRLRRRAQFQAVAVAAGWMAGGVAMTVLALSAFLNLR